MRADALRIAYFRGNGILFGKMAKFSRSCNVLLFSVLCFLRESKATKNAVIR